ncbi:MAG: O-antigen ligase family protein [Bryobacteraceae bacterium]
MRYPSSGIGVPNGAVLQAQRADELRSVGQEFAFKIYLLYLFVLYSRVFDFFFVGYHISAVLILAAVPAALLSGAGRNLSLRGPMKWMAAFVLWFGLAVPFSVWKGGSFEQFRFLLMTMVSLIPILGLPSKYRDLRRIFFVLGLAVSVFSVLSLTIGDFGGGRIFVEKESTFSNTNDMAQMLLLGLPFLLFSIYELRKQPIFAGLYSLLLVPVLVSLASTGSRSMAVAAAFMFVALFFRANITNKLRLLVVGGVLLLSGIVFLPRVVILRFMTFFEVAKVNGVSMSDYEAQVSALESTLSRQELFRASVDYTIKHPIVGVGPGMFSVARGTDGEKMDMGGAGMWKVTHNGYTQISSECGVPALIFFLLMLGAAYRSLRRADKSHRGLPFPVSESICTAAFAVQMALLGYAVFATFLSIGYQQHMHVIVAFTLTIERVAQLELERLKRAQNQPLQAKPSATQKFSYSMLPR